MQLQGLSASREHVDKHIFILQQLISKDFKLRYRRSVLGVLWSVLNPLMMMLIMSFVFQYFLRGASVENYALYLIVGNITFTLMSEATSTGLRSIIDAAPLLKKVKVQRWVFPVQKVCTSLVNFTFSLLAVALVMLVSRVIPTWHVVFMLVALVFLALFCTGVSLCIGALAVFFRDIMHLWSVAIMAWMYLTPIFWDISLLTNSHAPALVVSVVKLNPMYNYIEIMRAALVYQQVPDMSLIVVGALWALAALFIGLLVFKKTEKKFILFI